MLKIIKEYNLFYYFLICTIPISFILGSFILNTYLFIISLITIYYLFKNKSYNKILKEKWIIVFILYWIYLVMISFFSLDILSSLKNSLSQIRFLGLVLFLYFFLDNQRKLSTFFNLLSLTILFVSIDVIFQSFFTVNIFQFKSYIVNNPHMLGGVFGDELIVGSFIAFFSAPLIFSYISNLKEIKNFKSFYYVIFIVITFISVLLSGERMALIFYSLNLFIAIVIYFNLKLIILSFFSFSLILIFFSNFNDGVKNRYKNFIFQISALEKGNHIRLFSSAINIWKENKYFGVGLKNYRVICDETKFDYSTKMKTLCSTHPHNTIIEIIVETGLIGLILFFSFILFYLAILRERFSNLNIFSKPIFYGCLVVVIFYLWPIKSSGSFFSTNTAFIFWFYISICFLLTKKKHS